jgi:2-polyprenyl-3-methyl-5-hydroxy-6-metoxy-1,4-benzoquinol methylase
MELQNIKSESFDDTYIDKREFFGHPYRELQDFFLRFSKRGKVLDLGCGQGRDSLFLASLGYQVTAIDNSKTGIEQMMEDAKNQELKINGIVGDVFDIKLDVKFDVILFDMLLHSFIKSKQLKLLKKFSKNLNKKGLMCIIYPDDIKKEHFLNLLETLPYNWNLLGEIIIKDVPKIDGENIDFNFFMIIVELISF